VAEDSTTAGASDGNQDAGDGVKTGSSADGATGGTQTGADTFAAERLELQASARSFQSAKDRAEARSIELQARLDAVAAASAEGSDAGSPVSVAQMDPDALLASLEARFEMRASLKDAATALKAEYAHADPSLLARAGEFDSVESLTAAIKSSHEAVAAVVKTAVVAREAELKAEITEKYGFSFAVAPTDAGPAPAGDPTIHQIAAMSIQEQREFSVANPGVIARILRSAT